MLKAKSLRLPQPAHFMQNIISTVYFKDGKTTTSKHYQIKYPIKTKTSTKTLFSYFFPNIFLLVAQKHLIYHQSYDSHTLFLPLCFINRCFLLLKQRYCKAPTATIDLTCINSILTPLNNQILTITHPTLHQFSNKTHLPIIFTIHQKKTPTDFLSLSHRQTPKKKKKNNFQQFKTPTK